MKHTRPRKHLLYFRYLYFALALCGMVIAALANSPAPTQAALTPPAQAYTGVFERADCSQISGYAYDNDEPDSTIYVNIYADFKLIATVPADRFRRDLSFAGWANPYHGFLFPTPDWLKDGKTHQITVTFTDTGIGLSGNPKFIACNSSLFPTAVPDALASGEGQTWENGVEFSSSLSGIIREVKFWRAAEEPAGGHIAKIWTASGTLLKTAPFSETPYGPGWQYATVNFPITAGVRYRVTYNVNYFGAKNWNVFNNGPITTGPLTGWSSWYGTPAGSFPTRHSTSNLFADIVLDSPR